MTKEHTGQKPVIPDAGSIEAQVRRAAPRGLPPVEDWNPDYCGEMDLVIQRDGTWIHEGTPIGRPKLVKLFSTILKREGDDYFLVTPVEKLGIKVEDAPFVAVDFARDDDDLVFTTNVGDTVRADAEHPIRVERDAATGEPSPYILVRRNLEALIDRKSFYRLVDIGEVAPHDGAEWFGLRSGGQFFPVIPAAELP
ncbi:DUF1285 domain-containing protein [Maribius pontilimi]|uniref:DUF1285 domain-containing protein n=1 Tax=Palleronia pontilimi TaxID=1964209 RepID=A0A934IFI7_9RHOB|nr:DUF1285 domain-containing protein [Palleronia pontilimi]MBJ3762192.1 DUF1285 domain-containing protein [Palleronia pontilimi]